LAARAVTIVASVIGGYWGVSVARNVPVKVIRAIVVLVGAASHRDLLYQGLSRQGDRRQRASESERKIDFRGECATREPSCSAKAEHPVFR